MPFKVAITGKFRTGKDTLADMLQECLTTTHTPRRLAFAEALKWELSELAMAGLSRFSHTEPIDSYKYDSWLDWMNTQRSVNGVGWQWWGEFRRQLYGEDYWIKHPRFLDNYKEAELRGSHVILTDMRHHNEAEWCRSEGFYLVRIEGPCRAPDDVRDRDHPSERHVLDLYVDEVLHNEGSLDEMRGYVKDELIPTLRAWNDLRELENLIERAEAKGKTNA